MQWCNVVIVANANHLSDERDQQLESHLVQGFLVRVMNLHANHDHCIVLEQSTAFGEPGHVRVSSKVRKRGNRF